MHEQEAVKSVGWKFFLSLLARFVAKRHVQNPLSVIAGAGGRIALADQALGPLIADCFRFLVLGPLGEGKCMRRGSRTPFETQSSAN